MWLNNLALGPLCVRWNNPNYNRSHVIDYYWHDRYLFTSARWYLIFNWHGRKLIIDFNRRHKRRWLAVMWDGRRVY